MPYQGRGRKFPTHTPLGQLTWERGWSVKILAEKSGVYHRTLSDYLANLIGITPLHRGKLSNALGVHPDDLIPSTPPTFPTERECRKARKAGLWPKPPSTS